MEISGGLVRFAVLVASCGVAAACVTGADPSPDTTEAPLTIDDLRDDLGAYDISTHSAGQEPILPLTEPALVGASERHRVRVERADGGGRSQSASAQAVVEVINSIADGDGTWIRYTLGPVEASDDTLTRDLAVLEGIQTNFWLDQNRVGINRSPGELPEAMATQALDMAVDLLEVPLTLAMPIPDHPVGAGATWSGETRDSSGFVVSYEGEVVANGEFGFELLVVLSADMGDGEMMMAELVMSGVPGTVLPGRSSMLIRFPNGSTTLIEMERLED